MTIKSKQVTTPTYDSTTGTWIPAGGLLHYDSEAVDFVTAKGDNDFNTPNLRTPSAEGLPAPVAIAAIAPTGPNPSAPQQLPAGAVQIQGGYTNAAGAPLVAEGSAAAADLEIEEGGEPATATTKATGKATTKPAPLS